MEEPDKNAAGVVDETGHEATRTMSVSEESDSSAQDGVKAIEAIAMSWSQWGLIAAYLR